MAADFTSLPVASFGSTFEARPRSPPATAFLPDLINPLIFSLAEASFPFTFSTPDFAFLPASAAPPATADATPPARVFALSALDFTLLLRLSAARDVAT